VLGKSLFADLHEGKMTYPLLLAIERVPSLGAALAAACEQHAVCMDPELERMLTAVLWEKGIIEECIEFARLRSLEAIAALRALPPQRARAALEQLALALVHREK
jgi:octaprenyl-diphosphate synthase